MSQLYATIMPSNQISYKTYKEMIISLHSPPLSSQDMQNIRWWVKSDAD